MDNRFENAYVLNVLADDHPGIIAAVSSAVGSLDGNIDACSQTVLGGYFTLIMIVSFPQPVESDEIVRRVAGPPEENRGFHVSARPYVSTTVISEESPGNAFVLTAFGKDKPGIIAKLSQYLTGKDINIGDLYWDRTGEDFALISQVQIPSQRDLRMLQMDLEEMGRREGFTVRLQHENIFVATNQLRLNQPR